MAGLNRASGWIETLGSILDGTYQPKRKCRFLCKITRGIVQGIGSVVGGAVGTAISNAAGAIAFRESIDDYVTDLTLEEQELLQNWAEKHFIPFYEKLANKAAQIEVAMSLQAQLEIINEVEAQISLALANYKENLNNTNSNLSDLAKQEMYDYAEDNFAIIQEVYAQILAQINDIVVSDVEVFMKDYDFFPLFVAKLYPVTSTEATAFKVSDTIVTTPVETILPTDEDNGSNNQNPTENEKSKNLSWLPYGVGAYLSFKVVKRLFK